MVWMEFASVLGFSQATSDQNCMGKEIIPGHHSPNAEVLLLFTHIYNVMSTYAETKHTEVVSRLYADTAFNIKISFVC